MSSPEIERPPRPVRQVVSDADGADQIGDLLVERDVLAAAEHDDHVREPEQGFGLRAAEDRRELPPGLGGVDEGDPQRVRWPSESAAWAAEQ